MAPSVFLLVCLLAVAAIAAPFASKRIHFLQPDGTRVELLGWGDEFHAVFETPEGFTVVFDPAARAYEYARLSAAADKLEPAGMRVGQGDPAVLGLERHLRILPAAARFQAAERQREWESVMNVERRWAALKSARREREARARGDGPDLAPPRRPTTGTRVGLCLLIDFDDDPATIPPAEIEAFCNADHYTGYGNNGSVKEYFRDNSDGLLQYTNVVTAYVRIPNSLHPKSWYNDTTVSVGVRANYLIQDALTILKARPNYTSDILPRFNPLTVDDSGNVLACNVFFAGENSGVWGKGLWPHSSALQSALPQELSPGGKKLWRYQITDLGGELELGTFCHENGHMLCGYPDIYDYQFDSAGGAGAFCLMNSGGHGKNPIQICAYLKLASGWATTTDLTATSNLDGVLTAFPLAGYNHFYRYPRPNVPTEYFLLENRQATGRDANLPASGIALWHVDELGFRDNQSLVHNPNHANYELTLVQADDRWDFQGNVNTGDMRDLYYLGNPAFPYANRFDDFSMPEAKWWDGGYSGLRLSGFSAPGPTMTLLVGLGSANVPAPLLAAEPARTAGTSNTIAWTDLALAGSPIPRSQDATDTDALGVLSPARQGTTAPTSKIGAATGEGSAPNFSGENPSSPMVLATDLRNPSEAVAGESASTTTSRTVRRTPDTEWLFAPEDAKSDGVAILEVDIARSLGGQGLLEEPNAAERSAVWDWTGSLPIPDDNLNWGTGLNFSAQGGGAGWGCRHSSAGTSRHPARVHRRLGMQSLQCASCLDSARV